MFELTHATRYEHGFGKTVDGKGGDDQRSGDIASAASGQIESTQSIKG